MGWTTVQGQIVSSAVESHFSSGSGRRNHGGSTYQAEVHYEFTVDGVKYRGSRIAFGDFGSKDSSRASSVVQQYPEGKQVTVWYKPDDPGECVLEPGQQPQVGFLPAIGLGLIGFGSMLAILFPQVLGKSGAATEPSGAADGVRADQSG